MSALDPTVIGFAELPSQAELMARWGVFSEPEISIICNTFNHEKYVELALRSFLLQKTNKPFEIIVHDDSSQDGTVAVLSTFASAYPAIFRLILQSENQFSQGKKPTPIALTVAKGRYVALCEGDDFWADDAKLQLQWQALERDRDLAACSGHSAVVDGDGNILETRTGTSIARITQSDLLLGRKGECRTCTLMIRMSCLPLEWPNEALRAYAFDNFLRYIVSSRGDILVLPEVVGCYRMHIHGLWSSLRAADQRERRLHDLRLMLDLVSDDQKAFVEYRMAFLAVARAGIPLRERLASILVCVSRPKWLFALVVSSTLARLDRFRSRSERAGR